MILSEIGDYLRTRHQAPMADLVNRFDIQAEVLRPMLEVWMRKGRVCRIRSEATCGACTACGGTVPEVYRWIG
jgi:hypothetical protein